jgi:hypothetical protein
VIAALRVTRGRQSFTETYDMTPSHPQLIILCGLQASGKTSFYRETLMRTHVRISLDLLRTRNREERFLDLCLETRMPTVIDNTNPTRTERASYISRGQTNGFQILGYYFQSRLADCLARNAQREGTACIPEVGLKACASRLEVPTPDEGFDRLAYVRLQPGGGFLTEEWNDGLR